MRGLYLIGDLVVGKKVGSIITAFNSTVHGMKYVCVQDLPCDPKQVKPLSLYDRATLAVLRVSSLEADIRPT